MSTMALPDTVNLVIGEFQTVFKNKGLDPPVLSKETVLDGSLGLESLDFAEVVMRLEQVFGKDPFGGDTIPEVSTLADLCACLLRPERMSGADSPLRHVIISGGSRGLGKALVEGLLAAGYSISTFSRSRTEFIDQQSANPSLHYECADICDSQALSRFLDHAKERFGLPHGLVNCGVATVGVLCAFARCAGGPPRRSRRTFVGRSR